jgi:hypothetical protein
VDYRIGLAAREPFELFGDVVGVIISSPEMAAANPSKRIMAGETASGGRPSAIGLLHEGGWGPAARLLKGPVRTKLSPAAK